MNNLSVYNSLDVAVNTEFMRVCKCILPYLEKDVQRNVAISLKILELRNTINFYNDDDIESEISADKSEAWQKNLLSEIGQNISSDKSHIIDAVLAAGELKSMFEPASTEKVKSQEKSKPQKQSLPTYKDFSAEPFCQNQFGPPVSPDAIPSIDEMPNCGGDGCLMTPKPSPKKPEPKKADTEKKSSPQQSTNEAQNVQDIIGAFAPMLDDKQMQLLSMITTIIK
ncbi:MAG: hypothetical protein ATN36_08645 [Epulopiscium sp. Nele67-Bin005]|nr:MAG: hypothetical protein ATN36_08645 [Epulopiscium sp. Nele67-Bin005]